MKTTCFLLSFMSAFGLLSAQTDEDNIIIANQVETYEYFLSGEQVMIKQTTVTQYECTRMPASITVYEMYDNESSRPKVKVKGIHGVTPEYKMYTSGREIFYTDAKLCSFGLYFDKKGKTAEVEIEKIYRNPRYFCSIYFPRTEFIRHKEVSVVLPAWMDTTLKEYNFEGYDIEKEIRIDAAGNTLVYSYRIRNGAAMKNEPYMQGASFIYPHLLVLNHSARVGGGKQTFFETIADLYTWSAGIANQTQNDELLIKTKADELVKECHTDLDKIKTLFAWVQSNIRYVAFEDGIAAFKPDDAQEVLRKKYGDCKGMANLLKAMLKSQGYDSRLAWIGTNHIAYDYSTPALAVTNHMICALFHQGATYYLDATVEYMPLGEYPQTIQGRQVMIEDGDRFILDSIPVLPPRLNADSLYCTYRIAGGALIGEAEWHFRGESKQIIMSLIHSTAKDKLEEGLRGFVERDKVQDKASDIDLKNATPQSDGVSISYKINNTSGLNALGNEYYIDLNPDKNLMAFVVDTPKRANNILFPYRRYIVRQIVLEIPDGFEVSHLPENFSLTTPDYVYQIGYQQREREIHYTCRLIRNNPLILKSGFDAWNRDVEELKKHYLDQIVFTKL